MSEEHAQIIIFSGTTEGRELSRLLAGAGMPHTVCVATEYGRIVQEQDAFTRVHEGRLDREEMLQMLCGCRVVADATHPFAFVVTENIRAAAKELGIRYLRVLRPADSPAPEGCRLFGSMAECAATLNEVQGNILLTTGSKELKNICAVVQDRSRLYARVLPTAESLNLCEQAGIAPNHILALHGPFSARLNAELMAQYQIRCLVTRDSGKAGGFEEKLAAARMQGAECYVIRRPSETEGLSVQEAFASLQVLGDKPKAQPQMQELQLSIVGCGMGDPEHMTRAAFAAVQQADVLFGAKRLLEPFGTKEGEALYLAEEILPWLQEKLKTRPGLKAAVLFSGDISFYSGAGKFEAALRQWAAEQPNLQVHIQRYAGISSVTYLAARLGRSLNDACILSLHGRNEPAQIRAAANAIAGAEQSFVLLSTGSDLARLAEELLARGQKAEIVVGSRLSYAEERLIPLTLAQATEFDEKGLFTVYLRRKSL